MADRIGDWVQTFTGKQFYPLDPRPGEVCVEDVAHALANVCRFAGHCRQFYSVAQHSIACSLFAPAESALPALLHDAAEAYMGDIARPWKRFLCVATGIKNSYPTYEPIKTTEHRLLDAILFSLSCPPRGDACWKVVEEIDMRMLATEARDLMSPLADDWSNTFTKSPCAGRYAFDPYPYTIVSWAPAEAKERFLQRYSELLKR